MEKKVLCIGNALVDKVCLLENDDLLVEEGLPKGSMQLITEESSKRLQAITGSLKFEMATGGSAANTASGTANLGIATAYIGMVGRDGLGDFYIDDMKKNNIETKFFRSPTTQTGLALAFVSKDGERTFATYLGAALELNAGNLDKDLFSGYDYVHIEGYLISNRSLFSKILELSKSVGAKISMDLASYNVVEENVDFLRSVCKGVEIIFANEQEAEAFSGMNAVKSVDYISGYANISVVKLGEKGSLISCGDKTIRVQEVKRAKVDTTGAGDLYAGGFLAGLCQGRNLEQCGIMGSILAGNVIEIMGTKMDEKRWQNIRREISEKTGQVNI